MTVSAPLPEIDEGVNTGNSIVDLDQDDPVLRQVHVGHWENVPVLKSDSMQVGQKVRGPAIIESEFTTVVLNPFNEVIKNSDGTLIIGIEDLVSDGEERGVAAGSDPVTLSVVENRLESIAIEMMDVMLRTSMSQILNSSRDFSTAILDLSLIHI